MRKPCILVCALAICLATPWGENAAAQEATAGADGCILDPGAKAPLLFERQCLNAQEQGHEPPFSSTKRQNGLFGKMAWKAGLIKDDTDTKMLGFGAGYHVTPSTSFSGQAGFGGAPYSPQGAATFGFRFDF